MMFHRSLAVVALGAVLLAAPARAGNVHYVDDDGMDGFNCAGAPFRTINDALAISANGDEIRVCPGVYPEQLVINQDIRLTGEAFGSRRAVIRPTALPATLPSLEGGNPVAAAILIDGSLVRITDIDIDLTDNTMTACSPVLAGVYFRNASGSAMRTQVLNAWVPGRPDCDSGIGIFVESGVTDFVLGHPIFGRARVVVIDAAFDNYQKAGLVAHGPRTVLKLRGGHAIAGAPVDGAAVPNGYQVGLGARGKLVDATSSGHTTTTAGKLGAGILAWDSGKFTFRRDTITANQVGIFVAGNDARVKRSILHDQTSDGIVLLGDSNLVSATEIDGTSVSGCFVNGDRNLLRGSFITHSPIGIWIINGIGNLFFGTNFGDVPLESRGVYGGVRPLTELNAAPLLTSCSATSLTCDDGDPCSTDLCNLMTGTCSHGVTVCDDAIECTTDVCDPVAGCVFTPVPDGTPCTTGTASVCTGGVCT